MCHAKLRRHNTVSDVKLCVHVNIQGDAVYLGFSEKKEKRLNPAVVRIFPYSL